MWAHRGIPPRPIPHPPSPNTQHSAPNTPIPPMLRKEILLGYVLGALEEENMEKVEQELQRNEVLRRELASCRKELEPIEFYAQHTEKAFEAPPDLAERTCRSLWEKIDAGELEHDRELSARACSRPPAESADSEVLVPPEKDLLQRLRTRRKARAAAVDSASDTEQGPASSFFALPRIYTDSKPGRSYRSWKRSDFTVVISLVLLIVMILVPGVSFVKDQVRKVYYRNAINKIGENTSIASQLWGERAAGVIWEPGEKRDPGYTPTDFASFLSHFGEVDLTKKTFDVVYSPQSDSSDLRDSTFLVVHQPDENEFKQISQGWNDLSSPSDVSFSGFGPLLPQGLFNLPASQPVSRNVSFSAPMSFSHWEQAKTPVLSETRSGNLWGETVQQAQDQNIIILDGRVFIRK